MKYSPEELKKAKKRVKAKKDFYQHLMTYVIINAFLLILNLLTSPTSIWFYYPLLGWGVAVLFHYADVFGVPGFDILNQEWEERELQDELRRNEKSTSNKSNEGKEKSDTESLELKELRKNYKDSDLV